MFSVGGKRLEAINSMEVRGKRLEAINSTGGWSFEVRGSRLKV
jgi:hypothetical protein